MTSTVLVLSFTDHARDPRIHRQIEALSPHYRVISAGLAPSSFPDVSFVSLVPPARRPSTILAKARTAALLLAKQYDTVYWRQPLMKHARQQLEPVPCDLIVANDIECVPLALSLSRHTAVIADLHEYAPREFDEQLKFRLWFRGYVTHLCRKYLKQASAVITVCQGIAEEYSKHFGVKPTVVMNAAKYQSLGCREDCMDAERVRLVHHGGAFIARKLELMIELTKHLDERFELDLLLVPGTSGYLDRLRRLARGVSRIRFCDPVPMPQIAQAINRYDMGLYLLPPTNLNSWYSLPNKLFEFIQGRLAIAIGPSPEMAAIVRKYDIGVVSEDFTPEAMARQLNGLTKVDIVRFRRNAELAARELSAESQQVILLSVVESVLG